MTFLNDLVIDWEGSPRVITIPESTDTISIQDILDTLRREEGLLENSTYKSIVKAAGKEVLTADLKVGITLTLLDAHLAFTQTGSFQRKDIIGGNLLAVDDVDAAIPPILNTAFTQPVIDSSESPAQVAPTVVGVSRGFPIINP